jgi:diacylglycerol O-acyltransferase
MPRVRNVLTMPTPSSPGSLDSGPQENGTEHTMAANRLSGLDTAFLSLDSTSTPMNIGASALFAPTRPVHPTRLVDLVWARAERIPRLRQRVRGSLVRPGTARWVDDPHFDVTEHVHAHHLPRPHDPDQLTDLVAAIMAERLDPRRPLWEVHVVTGLPGGWFAVLPKLHHALADGAGALSLGLGLTDGGNAPPLPAARRSGRPTLGELRSSTRQAASIAGRCGWPPARRTRRRSAG